MVQPVTKADQAAIIAACFAELGMEAHPNTVKTSIMETPGNRGHVVTVANIQRGPLRVHVLAVAPDGSISRPRNSTRA